MFSDGHTTPCRKLDATMAFQNSKKSGSPVPNPSMMLNPRIFKRQGNSASRMAHVMQKREASVRYGQKNRKQVHTREFMTTQIKTEQKSKKSERIKVAQHRTDGRSESLTIATPRFGSTNGHDNHESKGIKAYAAQSATASLGPFAIRRRDVGLHDVQIEILYCGVCHSDLHMVRNEWGQTVYPCVPGHEIVGRVTGVGSEVKKFKEGDLAGVGCMVDSCRTCSSCHDGLEQYCEHGPIFTYNSEDKHLGGVTYGGYSKAIVVDEDFVLCVPYKLDPAAAAPLLCAGITTYSPLRKWKVGQGEKVGVVG